jgi:hypothetical protein
VSTTHFQIAYLLVGFSGTLLSNSFFLHASSLDARSIRQPLGSSPGGFFSFTPFEGRTKLGGRASRQDEERDGLKGCSRHAVSARDRTDGRDAGNPTIKLTDSHSFVCFVSSRD